MNMSCVCFFLNSSITFTLFYWYMSWIIGQEYNSSLLFVENQNGPSKHHHKFYSQITCPQFGVLKQRLLNLLPVRIKLYTKIHGKTIMVNKHKFINKIIFNKKFITLSLHDIHVCHNQALQRLIRMKKCLACCRVSTKSNS